MRNKIIYGMAAWLFLAMPSCVDLTETVYDKLPGDTFGSTETEVNALWVISIIR